MYVWKVEAEDTSAVPAALREDSGSGSVVSIGVFDGVHRGHQAVLGRARAVADALAARQPGRPRPLVVAMTFDPHPLAVHRPDLELHLVDSLADRLELLEQIGVDAALVVRYSLEFADQNPQEFVRDWLVDLLGARAVVVGDDVRFGRGNAGDAGTLQALGTAMGLEVEIVRDVAAPSGRRWSSTWVRELVEAGDVAGAAQVLGRPHRLRGEVVHGLRRGRELGFPTANVRAEGAGIVPPDGVYAGWLLCSAQLNPATPPAPAGPSVLDSEHDGQGSGNANEVPDLIAARPAPHISAHRASRTLRLPAAISIGTNPTFDDVPERIIEAHVLGRADLNLYGQEVVIELVEHLRPMLAFDGMEPLMAQMCQDLRDTSRVLGVPEARPVNPQDVTA